MTEGSNFNYERLTVPSGEKLFEYGDESSELYVLSKGALDLRHEGTTITTISERDHPLGAAGVVLNTPRQYTTLTREKSSVKKLPIDKGGFFDWLQEHPLKLEKINQNYAQLLDYFNERNKENFKIFRTYRSLVDNLIQPLSRIENELDINPNSSDETSSTSTGNLDGENPIAPLLKTYRLIVTTTGRSDRSDLSGLDVPEESLQGFEAGEEICSEGDTGKSFYILIDGSLSVLKGDQRVAVLDQRGSVFGEMSPYLRANRRATVKADTDARVSVISHDQLQALLEDSPELSQKLIVIFFRRFRRAVTLNHRLRNFLSYVKALTTEGDVSEALKSYINQLLEVLDETEEHDPKIEDAKEKLRHWINNECNSLDDHLPSGSLRDFTSEDMKS
ncbi:MAG: cyclic nucleotide-binding domain-containing protein [bacterium]